MKTLLVSPHMSIPYQHKNHGQQATLVTGLARERAFVFPVTARERAFVLPVMARERAFTLIELLAVMAIVSILTALTIPRFQEYRAKAYDTRARMDLHHAAIAEEAYFIDYEAYHSCTDLACTSSLPGLVALSPGVTLTMTGTLTGFTGTSQHRQGSNRVFRYESGRGGFIN